MSASRWRRDIETVLVRVWPTLVDGPDWIQAQVQQESGGDPEARSPAGAVGLLQLMPATAKELGLEVESLGPDERLMPTLNLQAGVRYLKLQYDHFPELPEHLDRMAWSFAAYNGGRGYCNKALALARENHISNWATWTGASHFLADPLCVVRGRRPDAKQIWGYVRKIREGYERLKAAA